MTDSKKILNEIDELKALMNEMNSAIVTEQKYLSAKDVESEFGIPSKTVLNRSNLPSSNPRYLPFVRFKGGRKKYFERKVLERLLS